MIDIVPNYIEKIYVDFMESQLFIKNEHKTWKLIIHWKRRFVKT